MFTRTTPRMGRNRFASPNLAARISAFALAIVSVPVLAAQPVYAGQANADQAPRVGRIVYSKVMKYDEFQDPSESSLYILDQGRQRRLTNGGAHVFDDSASWSPNGLRIAFVRSKGASSQVRVIDRSGANSHVLGTGSDPTWSPQRRGQVAFVEGDNERNCLTVANPNGTAKRQLSCVQVQADPQTAQRYFSRYMQPQWSSDGRYIFATVYSWKTGGAQDGIVYNIRQIDADSGTVTELTANQQYGFYTTPQPARGGRWMSYCDCLLAEPDYYDNHVGTFDLVAGKTVALAEGSNPVLSAKEKMIAFTDPQGRLGTVAITGGTPRYFANDTDSTYAPVAWIRGDRSVLVNKSRYMPVPNSADRLVWRLVQVDPATGKEKTLADGKLHPGGVF